MRHPGRVLADVAVAVGAIALIAVPIALAGWPTDPRGAVAAAGLAASGAPLGLWRRRPVVACLLGPALTIPPLLLGIDPPDLALVVLTAYGAVAGERFAGRGAWLAGLGLAGYLVLVLASTDDSAVGLIVLGLPGYLAGTALRWRRHAAEALAARGRELEEERAAYTAVAIRNERARIAAELHDIVGHAVSVMVVQAAAGQRLVDRDPEAARVALGEVGEAARRGRADLERLLRLLGGEAATPDITVVRDTVEAAARAGLDVSCRVDGDLAGVPGPAAHVAVRVVQEGLTNALRHAPGTAVRVRLWPRSEPPELAVLVENDPSSGATDLALHGTGRGLAGLRTRAGEVGGSLTAAPTPDGGWRVEAHLPTPRT